MVFGLWRAALIVGNPVMLFDLAKSSRIQKREFLPRCYLPCSDWAIHA